MKKKLKHIKIKDQEYYLNIILDRREKKNALNPLMIQEIQSVLNFYKNNKTHKIILFTSSSNVFCAGADIKYLEKIKDFSYSENLKDSKLLMRLYKTMLTYPKLIISKVNGAAVGGGCGLITASDIVFSTEESIFGYPEVKIGFIPALVSTFLIAKIKEIDAREILLTGKILSPQKAKEIGLINYIFSSNKIDSEIEKFIRKSNKNLSGNSIKETKEMLYLWLDLDKKLKKASELNAKNRKTQDFKIGINSFLNKENLNWKEVK